MVGKECLPVFEELSIPDQIVENIPSPGMVTTSASIAVVATSSALLAKPLVDLLLKGNCETGSEEGNEEDCCLTG